MNQSHIYKGALDCLKLIKYHSSDIKWYNAFRNEFLQFTGNLHVFLLQSEQRLNNDVIFLCLQQICNCMNCIECEIKVKEQKVGKHSHHIMTTSIQHFVDRIRLCMDRLCSNLDNGALLAANKLSFCDLMNKLFDYLEPYENEDNTNHSLANCDPNCMRKIRDMIDEVLSQCLAFANIALDEDKRALGALCQQVFRECMNFQAECQQNTNTKQVNSNRKLIAASLMQAMYKLEDYINRTLLRLIYVCFLGYEKYSIEKLRTMQLCGNIDESTLDEFIADFDVNLDRTTQIGVFASAFASNIKTKTIIRSCLASFEALDSFLIPAILSKPCERLIGVDILEQHFNEEIMNFKNAIQEIIDSHAFAICYQDQVVQCILLMEKDFCKNQLDDIVDMGYILCKHFDLKSNRAQLENAPEVLQTFNKFVVILRECTAILVCCKQIDNQRILKRFKILRSILDKFIETLYKSQVQHSTTIEYGQNNSTALSSLQNINTPNDQRSKEEEAPSSIAKLSKQARVFRKDSLRTQIFKRKKPVEMSNIEGVDSICSSSNETNFLMSEILNQLTLLSTDTHVQQNTK